MNMKKLLYKSFDTGLSDSEKYALNEALKSSSELRKMKADIEAVRNAVKDTAITDFSPGFQTRLLNEISRSRIYISALSSFTDSLTLSFRKVAFSAAIILMLLIGYNLNEGNNYIFENILGISKPAVENAFDPTIQFIWTATK
jgi:hypothetical protein